MLFCHRMGVGGHGISKHRAASKMRLRIAPEAGAETTSLKLGSTVHETLEGANSQLRGWVAEEVARQPASCHSSRNWRHAMN
jgi:hypothetical protein